MDKRDVIESFAKLTSSQIPLLGGALSEAIALGFRGSERAAMETRLAQLTEAIAAITPNEQQTQIASLLKSSNLRASIEKIELHYLANGSPLDKSLEVFAHALESGAFPEFEDLESRDTLELLLYISSYFPAQQGRQLPEALHVSDEAKALLLTASYRLSKNVDERGVSQEDYAILLMNQFLLQFELRRYHESALTTIRCLEKMVDAGRFSLPLMRQGSLEKADQNQVEIPSILHNLAACLHNLQLHDLASQVYETVFTLRKSDGHARDYFFFHPLFLAADSAMQLDGKAAAVDYCDWFLRESDNVDDFEENQYNNRAKIDELREQAIQHLSDIAG